MVADAKAAAAAAAPDATDDALLVFTELPQCVLLSFIALPLRLLLLLPLLIVFANAVELLLLLLFMLFRFWNICWLLVVISVPCALSPINQPPANGVGFTWMFVVNLLANDIDVDDAGGWCTCTWCVDTTFIDGVADVAVCWRLLLCNRDVAVPADDGVDTQLLPGKFDTVPVTVVVPLTWLPVNDVT